MYSLAEHQRICARITVSSVDLESYCGNFVHWLRAIPAGRGHSLSVRIRVVVVVVKVEVLPHSHSILLSSRLYALRLIETLAPPASSRPLTGGDDKRAKRENIQHFLDSCKAYGMAATELFEVEDLLSMQDIPKVTRCLYALGKHVMHCNPFKISVIIRFRSFCVGCGKIWQTWTGHTIRWVAHQSTEWAHGEPSSAQWNAYWRWSPCVTCQHQLAKRSTREKQSKGCCSHSQTSKGADFAANAIETSFRVESNAGAEWRESTCQNRSSSNGQPYLTWWQHVKWCSFLCQFENYQITFNQSTCHGKLFICKDFFVLIKLFLK